MTCGPKRAHETWNWRKLHNEEPHDLYNSSNIFRATTRRRRWAGSVACMVKINAYRVLVRQAVGRRPLWKTQA
jgi:hypothetical protein